LAQKIDSFYRDAEAYEIKKMRGEDVPFDEERIISGNYAELWLDETGNRYMALKGELYETYCEVMNMIETKFIL